MKKIINYILLATTMLFASCDALDLAPQDYNAEGNFWNNEAQVDGFMTGLHIQLRAKANTFFVLGEQRGGLLRNNGTFGTTMDNINLINHNLKESSPGFNDWAGFYGNIIQLNLFIGKLEGNLSFLSESKANYYLGQAHGLRALYYFYLLRTYGGVPLITEPKVANGTTNPNALHTARSTEEQIMDFLKKEITLSETCFASDNFTLSAKRDRWSKAATLMLKAEIYLWSAKLYGKDLNKDLDAATTALNTVKSSNKFDLLPYPDFGKVFIYDNKGNKEIIMAIHFEKGEAEQNMRRFMYDIPMMANYYNRNGEPMGDPLNVGDRCILANEWKWDFYETFGAKDTRKDVTFLDFYNKDKTKGGIVLHKFLGVVDNNIRNYSDDMPLYRYADILLMMAEIKNMKHEDPSGEINDIRKRACGEGNYDVYTNKTFAENERAILAERDKEFVCEGKRWFDVRRMHDESGKPLAFTLSGLSETEAYKLLWPINTGIMTYDPLVEQTPGYPRGE